MSRRATACIFPSATGKVDTEKLGLKQLPRLSQGGVLGGRHTTDHTGAIEPTPNGPTWSDGEVSDQVDAGQPPFQRKHQGKP